MKNILMCRPKYYQVKYKINPWMQVGDVDTKNAILQWDTLVKSYKKIGLNVNIIDQEKNLPDEVFAADQGIFLDDKTVIVSRFRFKERQRESSIYKKWYETHGFKTIIPPSDVYLEGGGETIKFKDKLFVGTGFRNNFKAVQYLKKEMRNKFEVIELELINKRFYHLDTCFFALDNKYIFYYPPAFSQRSIKEIEKCVDKTLIFTEQDVLGFAANSVSIGNYVFVQSGNPNFKKQIETLGYFPIEINISEFIKSGGGIHCLTGILGNN